MKKSRKQRRPHLLSSTRPRNIKPTPSLSSHTTRTLVRTHHTLRKKLSSALENGNDAEAKELQAQIDDAGGLAMYQQASIQGQAAQRGGDTSKILIRWLAELGLTSNTNQNSRQRRRMLEVGSLRTDNACSKSGLFEMERIDLHSQHPAIKEQDFMDRPIPSVSSREQEGFDIVSLSLVVNFVSNSAQRGEMLKRIEAFLRSSDQDQDEIFPALFLVLPVACVNNSRYLDEERLKAIMESLGYRLAKSKLSAKLIYQLWKLERGRERNPKPFRKEEIRSGKVRNNFAITLR